MYLGHFIIQLTKIRWIDILSWASNEVAFRLWGLFLCSVNPFVLIFIKSGSTEYGILQNFFMSFLSRDRFKVICKLKPICFLIIIKGRSQSLDWGSCTNIAKRIENLSFRFGIRRWSSISISKLQHVFQNLNRSWGGVSSEVLLCDSQQRFETHLYINRILCIYI